MSVRPDHPGVTPAMLLRALGEAERLTAAGCDPNWSAQKASTTFGVDRVELVMAWLEKLVNVNRARAAVQSMQEGDNAAGGSHASRRLDIP